MIGLHILSTLLILIIPANKPAKHPAGLFYQITKVGSADTSYLFGTLHLLEQGYVDTMPAVMHAVNRADIILGEIVLDSAAKKEAATLTAADAPLDEVLTKKQYARVDSELQRVMGVPLQFFNGFQPLAIYAVLIQGYYKKAHPENIRNGMLMDLYFQHLGKKAGKEVRGLESLSDETDALFGSMTIKSQVHELMDLVNHKWKVMSKLDEMLTAYQAGDLAKLITEDDMEGAGDKLMTALLTKRNAVWLNELPSILASHNAFIAVGAGHLGGSHGLVEGLRKRGFTIVALSPI